MSGLYSMTGFSRLEGTTDSTAWTWEIKSVNGRNLDMRIRLPYGFDQLDPLIRKAVAGALARGTLSINLSIREEAAAGRVRVNEETLSLVLAAIENLRERIDVERPRPEGILALRGVLEQSDEGTEGRSGGALLAGLMEGFARALAALLETRGTEGEQLRPLLTAQIDRIAHLADRAAEVPGHQPQALRARLDEQIRTVLDDHRALDPARLHQEVALLVTKADVREEIDRLKSHCGTAHDLLAKGGPVGRRLDHLSQEFNREANTLCSKSSDVEMTGIGLELKAVIDQFREQIQNLE